MAFVGASHFSITGDVNTYILGDLNISYTSQTVQGQERTRTIYDEFPYIQRGLVCRVRDLHRKNRFVHWNSVSNKYEIEFKVERIVSTAEIPGHSSRYTVVSYKGQDAEKAWEKDFRQWCEASDASQMQLFGINRSSIPFLLFHRELVPLAHFADRIGEFGRIFASTFARNTMGCRETELWMDPKGGTLIHGVEGPHSAYLDHLATFHVEEISPSPELFLQEDVSWRFFSHLPLNKAFDGSVIYSLHWKRGESEKVPFSPHLPYILSNRYNLNLAFDSRVWESSSDRLDSPVLMPNGQTRFSLTHDGESSFELEYGDRATCSWLSHASSVFHNLGISLSEDLSDYKFTTPYICLAGSIDNSKAAQQRRLQLPPIYFFLHAIHLFPTQATEDSYVSVHSWSHDENGQTSIPHYHCESLGLPTRLRVEYLFSCQYFWPTETYKTIHNWQIARGFDPITNEFACYCEYPMLQVIPPELSSRFEEVKGESIGSSPTSVVVENSRESGRQRFVISSIWSVIVAPLTSVACEELDISVVLI
ncbi:hypothetical protein L218DRAFT_92579 [Marasmius fiardii PR-910]|nr:hypothetical protein L218DRAFT_92579 [Marasmius fiardii PR-910]